VEVLRAGGSAVDAVEAGIRLVEDNPEEHSVGLGGLPNIWGMWNWTPASCAAATAWPGRWAACAVTATPSAWARPGDGRLPHVLLVGAGAERFAAEIGADRGELLTEEARRMWAEKQALLPPGGAASLRDGADLAPWVAYLTVPVRSRGNGELFWRRTPAARSAAGSAPAVVQQVPGAPGATAPALARAAMPTTATGGGGLHRAGRDGPFRAEPRAAWCCI
jgi:beta-aspartyl-peptidase (threonine type)